MSDRTIVIATDRPTLTPRLVRPLRVIIPGGEGHLGRILVRHLSAQGHKLTTLSRNPGPKAHPWNTLPWDGQSPGAWTAALEGADVLINLSGRSVDCRYTPANRAEILRSRVDSTIALGRAMQSLKHPPRLWLNASTATIYRHTYDRPMDEFTGELGGQEPEAPPTWRFSIDVARQWEQAFFASPTPETRKIALRAAMVMSPEPGGIFPSSCAWSVPDSAEPGVHGRQYMSWIHDAGFRPRHRIPDRARRNLRSRKPRVSQSASQQPVFGRAPRAPGESGLACLLPRGCWPSAHSFCAQRQSFCSKAGAWFLPSFNITAFRFAFLYGPKRLKTLYDDGACNRTGHSQRSGGKK